MEEIFEIFLIDEEGRKISSDSISSHIGLEMLVIENDKKLKEEFKNSSMDSELVFLLEDKGYMAVSQINTYYKKLTCDTRKLSEKQLEIEKKYCQKGFEINDLAIEKDKIERGEI